MNPYDVRERTAGSIDGRARQFVLGNDLEFVNPGGRQEVLQKATRRAARSVVEGLRETGKPWERPAPP
jgi:hypothetical protein